jgi:Domain of unknown function (DUF4868)
MSSLYALCRTADDAPLRTRRISITNEVQGEVTGLFEAQAIQFLEGVTDEVAFGSDWRLDPEEIFSTDLPPDAAGVLASLTGNPMALQQVNSQQFAAEGIRALATVNGAGPNARVFIQRFTAQQMLQRRYTFMLDGNTFNRMTAPAFTLENNLVAILEDGKLKFKSFPNVKRIFSLTHIYQEATDQQIDDFCAHQSLAVSNIAAFKVQADQTSRKLIHAITQSGILDTNIAEIVAKANLMGLVLNAADGKIQMPQDKKTMKLVLRFLDDGIYKAPLTDRTYMTNSKRQLH